MSMRGVEPGEVPAETAEVAHRTFPKGSLAIRVRDELGVLFRDEDFAALFPSRGRPAWSPGRLAMVLVLQFAEGLTDRQAAEAVRARIDWKYCLGLELTDPGFDRSVLSEFRDRLIDAETGRGLLDAVLDAADRRGLLNAAGRARTDSTHVLSSARELTRLELVGESLRSALNALALTAPDWLSGQARPEWFDHYATRIEETRFPKSLTKRAEIAERIGTDGMCLLRAVHASDAPPHLRELPAVEILRRVWVQHFHLVEGNIRSRDVKDRPPGATRLVTPHDIEARVGIKRDTLWDGYKVHLTETCEQDAPNLVTQVETTVATVPDMAMTRIVQDDLAERGLLPSEHLVDAGYIDARLIVRARDRYGVELVGPTKVATNWQARSGGYTVDDFTIDWGEQRVECPGGKVTTRWNTDDSRAGTPLIRVRFNGGDCRPCTLRERCTTSTSNAGRRLTLQPREEHEVLRRARIAEATDAWKARYGLRAGIEGTISQGTHVFDLRRSRYRGLAKTALQHQITGAAINLVRINAWINGTPRAATRTSHLAALRPAE